MSEEKKCVKCGGRLKEGQIYINVNFDQTSIAMSPYMMASHFSSAGLPSTNIGIDVEGPVWLEESEKEEGRIFKRKEKKKLPLRGMRCIECGYVELFAK